MTRPWCAVARLILWRWLALAALAVASGTTALAAPEDALPFVGTNGLVTRAVRYSDVVKALGEPPVSKVIPGNRTSRRPTGDSIEFSYPHRGLSFLVNHDERPKTDPLIEVMTVRQPAVGETPQGLRVGQPRDDALRLLSRYYREAHRYQGYAGAEVSSVVVRDLNGSSPRSLWVMFDQGAVSSLRFDLQDPPVLSASTRKFLVETAFLAVVLALGVGWVKLRTRLGLRPIPDDDKPARLGPLGVGLVLLFAGFALVGGLILGRVLLGF